MLSSQTIKRAFFILILSLLNISMANSAEFAENKLCYECHDAKISDHIKAMKASKHWDSSIKSSPVNKRQCQSCHGMSKAHADVPTKRQPQVSYGPRWTSSIIVQNNTCLSCHEKTATHKQWRSGKHAEQEVTCVTCHDVHALTDPVRINETQKDVCTVCHKVQKHGIHNKEENIAKNPPCSTCHNPHANPLPTVMMLANRSEGCRSCHDFREMEEDITVSTKAKSYHRVMQKDDRTCVDCHRGVAHVDESNFRKTLLGGLTSSPLNLFYPGQSDGDWLLEEHKGAQALRQGRNCLQCHIGDAKSMGESLAPKGVQAYIEANLTVKKQDDNLLIRISWQGSEDDKSVAIMFDDGKVDAFSRQGCWAACHNNMPGMTSDRSYGLKKYLLISQKQKYSIGTPAITHDQNILEAMQAKGEFVDLWRAELSSGQINEVKRFSILETRAQTDNGHLEAAGGYKNGQWTVAFTRPLADSIKPIDNNSLLTFGIAIHRKGQSGAQHRVSLPMTISVDGKDTNFILN